MSSYKPPKNIKELCNIAYHDPDEAKRYNKHLDSPLRKRLDIDKVMNHIEEKYPHKFKAFIYYINDHYQDEEILKFLKDNNIPTQKTFYRKLKGEEKLSYSEKKVFGYLKEFIKDLEIIEENNQNKPPDFFSKNTNIFFEVKGGYAPYSPGNESLNSLMNKSLTDIANKDVSRSSYFIGVFYINLILQSRFGNAFLKELLFSDFFTEKFEMVHALLFYFQQAGGNFKNKKPFFVVKNKELKQILEKYKFKCLFIKEISNEKQEQLIKIKEKRNTQFDNQIDQEAYKIYGITEKEKKIIEETLK